MRKVILEVASREVVNRRFRSALAGKAPGTPPGFESPALPIKVLSGRRWDLLQVMTGADPMTIREVARRMKRDVKAVHADVHTLLAAGPIPHADQQDHRTCRSATVPGGDNDEDLAANLDKNSWSRITSANHASHSASC